MTATLNTDQLRAAAVAFVAAEQADAVAALPGGKAPTTIKAEATARQKASTARAALWQQVAASLVLPPTPPPAPTGLAVTAVGASLVSKWKPSLAADGYDVWVDGVQVGWPRVDGTDGAPFTIAADGTCTYTHTGGFNQAGPGVAAGVHAVTVAAYNGQGVGAMTAPGTATVGTAPNQPPPVTPTPTGLVLAIFPYDQTPAVANSYATQLGIAGKVGAALVHLDMTSWATLTSLWFQAMWQGQGKRMIITFCPFPSGGTLAAAASGAYAVYWKQILAAIAAVWPDAILRFGHEMNCCYPWGCHTAADTANYIKMWQVWVPLVRAASTKFVTCWNPFYGVDPTPMYPKAADGSDTLVDLVATDVYGFAGCLPAIVTGVWGLNQMRDFAKAHGKPCAVLESNPATYPKVAAQGDNDDPQFVTTVAAFVKDPASNCAFYVTYNDDNADVHSDLMDGTKANSAAAFRQQWATPAGLAAWAAMPTDERGHRHAAIARLPLTAAQLAGLHATHALHAAREWPQAA